MRTARIALFSAFGGGGGGWVGRWAGLTRGGRWPGLTGGGGGGEVTRSDRGTGDLSGGEGKWPGLTWGWPRWGWWSPHLVHHLPHHTKWPIPWCISCQSPSPQSWTDKCLWKYNLRSLRFAGGTKWFTWLMGQVKGICLSIVMSHYPCTH